MTTDGDGFTEDETCRQFVLPALTLAGWSDEQITPEYRINAGRIRATAKRHHRYYPLRADYALEYRPGLVIGVIEAKRTRVDVAGGIEQARRYAQLLDVPFAYATNGTTIYRIDMTGNSPIGSVSSFPGPEELWEHYRAAKEIDPGLQSDLTLTPFDQNLRNPDNTPKRPRYYQRIAVDRTVRAIAQGDKRLLLVLATGTGKTLVAHLIVAKLWQSGWTPERNPRVLYLADRNMLVDQPKDEYFAPVFGGAVHKLGKGVAKRGRHIYFALYQSLESSGEQGDEQTLFQQYSRDYFDLIIVDECHRGSAREHARWREILDYFYPATQLGLTATPINEKDADTYHYFGNPIYEYSLDRGIKDGFLAPYRVRKVRLNVDMTGWQPEPGQQDLYGRDVPDRQYGPTDYERRLAPLERTEEAAQYLTDYLHRSDSRTAKTVVFCQDNEHAHRMREALHNANLDMVRQYPNYVCRITDADGDAGRALLAEFKKTDTDEPVIVVTSRLLSTGVDLPNVRNIVLFRRISSMPEFKQIVGRGTRLCLETHKLTFDIVDFVEATRLFNDPGFDGPPLRVTRDDTDDEGHIVGSEEDPEAETDEENEEVAEPTTNYEQQDGGALPPGSDGLVDDPDQREEITANARKKLYVDGVDVYVWNEALYLSEGDGQRLRLVEYRQYVRNQVLQLNLSPTDLRAQWAQAKSRRKIVEELQRRGIEQDELTEKLGMTEADPIDVMLHVAWELPLVSREERVQRVRREQREFFDSFSAEAREILELVLEKYAEHGVDELSSQALRVAPFDEMGSVTELASRFGGSKQLRDAMDELGQRLFDVA